MASELDKQIIEDEARNTPGVSQVFSELRVATQTQQTSEMPPPPPEPGPESTGQDSSNPPHSEVIVQPLRPEPKAALAPRPDAEPRKTVTPDLAMARDEEG